MKNGGTSALGSCGSIVSCLFVRQVARDTAPICPIAQRGNRLQQTFCCLTTTEFMNHFEKKAWLSGSIYNSSQK